MKFSRTLWKPASIPQKQAGVQDTTLFSNLWKGAHLERSVFHVIKLSACSWPIYDLWCQMLAKVIQHFNKIPSFSPQPSSLSDADSYTEGVPPLLPS